MHLLGNCIYENVNVFYRFYIAYINSLRKKMGMSKNLTGSYKFYLKDETKKAVFIDVCYIDNKLLVGTQEATSNFKQQLKARFNLKS